MAEVAVKIDGVSMLVLLKGGKAPHCDYRYGKLHEDSPNLQATHNDDWKAFQNSPSAAVELC